MKQKIKYPDILINIFNNDDKEKFSFSGLFMPLNLLYFVKDNIIYLWDYANNDSYTYREITSVIVNLHITLPKKGVFSPDVKLHKLDFLHNDSRDYLRSFPNFN